MSNGPLPPVPDLIPIAVLRKSSPCNNNNSGVRRECTPCATHSEVMGEQRSRRTGSQPAVDLIDSAQSRGPSAAPQAPQSRKARSERHRKSDRRREHRKPTTRTRSGSKHSSKSRETSTPTSSPERPANPRVNPIFVWVRQEDTRIVDVKCEDYDKRNRILLTKTAQGWRAIPRTETLVPSLKEAVDKDQQQQQHHHHHHHHHRNRKSRKSKVRRKSAAVQVDSDINEELMQVPISSPTWTLPVNVESHLPSHKIHIPVKCPSPEQSASDSHNSVNSVVIDSAQTQPEKCSAGNKMCDVSPLDNLLAVAEFEFNQHMQSGEWNKTVESSDVLDINDDDDDDGNNNDLIIKTSSSYDEIIDKDQEEFINNMEQLNNLLASCSKENDGNNKIDEINNDFAEDGEEKTDECDYTEDDDNNLAMDDILSRLEQSLQSPECPEIGDVLNENSQSNFETKIEDLKDVECFPSDINENNYKSVPDEFESYFNEQPDEDENNITSMEEEQPNNDELINEQHQQQDESAKNTIIEDSDIDYNNKSDGNEEPVASPLITENLVESSTIIDDEPTDLSIKPKHTEPKASTCVDIIELPTDLSVPKNLIESPRPRSPTPRPQSQNSETIQSPQPSGIPAVPPSPDIIVSPNLICPKNKSIFLESLLSTTSTPTLGVQKIVTHHQNSSEVTMVRQKEPLDLGKCRKSASPTVSCSEEVKNNKIVADLVEPPAKKFKTSSGDATLKNLLNLEASKSSSETVKTPDKIASPETPRLLELLKTDSGPDPLTQLRQILYDTNFTVPDPMLVPKERLSQIISHPAREIPRLMKQRPELRLPEALAFPHLLQDPDILVITLQQLETIIIKQNQSFAFKDVKNNNVEKVQEKSHKRAHDSTTKDQVLRKKSVEGCGSVGKSGNLGAQGKNGAVMNELASDIDAATTAAFNQVMWLPYLNQMEAMSFGNNPDIMKLLSTSLPMYPGQMADINHLVSTNRFPSAALGFPPPINYNHSLEMSMWQEAMMQANMLRPFDGLGNTKNSFRDYLDKFNVAPAAPSSVMKKPMTMNNNYNNKMSAINKLNLSGSSASNFYPLSNNNSHQHSLYSQNSFLNTISNNSYQPNNSKQQNLQIPQHYNSTYAQKNLLVNQHQTPSSSMPQQQHPYNNISKSSSSSSSVQKVDTKSNFANFYNHHQKMEEKMPHSNNNSSSRHHHQHQQQHDTNHKPKLSCKSFANVSYQKHASALMEQKERSMGDFSSKHHHHPATHHQPIDLSGSTMPGSKLKVKQHLVDPANTVKLLKHDDIAEVGSTTASIEEMQDAHKHLWHPLFGK